MPMQTRGGTTKQLFIVDAWSHAWRVQTPSNRLRVHCKNPKHTDSMLILPRGCLERLIISLSACSLSKRTCWKTPRAMHCQEFLRSPKVLIRHYTSLPRPYVKGSE